MRYDEQFDTTDDDEPAATTALPYRYRLQPDLADAIAGPDPYPRPTRAARPPAELGSRLRHPLRRRRWRAEQAAARRATERSAVRSWRVRTDDQIRALGPAMLIVAVLAALGVLAWSRLTPGPALRPEPAVGPAPVTTTTAPPPAPTAPTVTPSAAPGGSDAAELAAPAGLFDGPDGQTAAAFTAAWNTYTPAQADPGTAWAATLAPTASPTVVAQAAAAAPRLWLFTTQRAVTVLNPQVTGTRTGATWALTVTRTLFPIGGDQTSPTSTDQITLTLSVTGGKVTAVTQAGTP